MGHAGNSAKHDSPDLTILVVPGSFSPRILYSSFIEYLEHYGYDVVFAHYPSIGRRSPLPPATTQEDSAHVASLVAALADAGRSVLVVTHSYGGIPGTDGCEGLLFKDRALQGKLGGVVGIVYVTSLVARPGESLVDLMGAQVTSNVKHGGDYMSQIVDESAKFSFSDMPFSEGLECAKMMPDHSTVSFYGGAAYPAYKHVPVSYIFCTNDRCVLPALQQRIIDMLINEAGVDVRLFKLDCGHCPNVSIPRTLGRIVRTVIEGDI